MKPEVKQAISEVEAEYSEAPVRVREDGEGGAYVIVEEVDLGPLYHPSKSWIGFRITFQYPYSDTYPHYVCGNLSRVDGRPLGEGTSSNVSFEGRAAVQISRRSNRLDPRAQTALIKLKKVLAWLASRT
jgi:hypothetical protein